MTELLGIGGAVFASAALLDPDRPRRGLWMSAALVLAATILLTDQWDSSQIEALRDSPAVAVGLLFAGLVVTGLVAWLFLEVPVAFPIAVVIALPFRIPVELGGETANLLLPLYLVIAAGVLAWLVRSRTAPDPPGDSPEPGRWARMMIPLLAASVLLYAVAITWSVDPSRGLQDLAFFLIPFAVLFSLLTGVEWNGRLLRLVFIVLVAQALVCAAVGFVQFLTRELFWNDAVIRTNDFHVYFRVNSLFWDPNLYGRFLALVITAVVAVIAWSRNRRTALWLSAVALVLWLSLFTTFSQSSFLALAAGIAAVIALRWSLRAVVAGVAAAAVATLVFLSVGGEAIKFDLERLNPQTGGRADLVSGGLELFGDRPIAGYGGGSFGLAFSQEVAGPDAPVTESHTEPVTVAAETGLVGLLVYFGLLAASLFVLLAGTRSTMPGLGQVEGGEASGRGPPVARAAVFAAYIGLLVHTVFYAGYLHDPVTWFLLAIGYGLAFRCRAT